MPLVSVLVPAFNVERFIAQSVASALKQTLDDIEVIVINDGSTDGTAEALTSYMDQIVYAEQSNRGLAGARNAALARATGKYVALLDGDDFWPPDRLEKMVPYLESHPEICLATSDAFLVYDTRASTDRAYTRASARWGFRSMDQDYWIVQYNFMQIHTVMRAELFDRHGFFDEALKPQGAEDWDLWIRALTSGDKAGLVDEPLAYYRLREGSLSNKPLSMVPAEVSVLEKTKRTKGELPGLRGRLAYAKAIASMMEGDTQAARAHFRAATRDKALNRPMHSKARVAAVVPGLSWRMYQRSLKIRKAR